MDVLDYLKFLAALVFVLALIGALAYFARRHGLGGMVAPIRARDRRLFLIESLAIDPRHRLVLVRRDTVEYVLLIGNTNMVIERISVSPDSLTENQESSASRHTGTCESPHRQSGLTRQKSSQAVRDQRSSD